MESSIKKAVFVLDGGLSNDVWRRHAKGLPSYDELGCNDEPNVKVVEELKRYREAGDRIYIATDRSEAHREPLVNWLIRNADLRPGAYRLFDGPEAVDMAAAFEGVSTVFTPFKNQCERLYDHGNIQEIYLVKPNGQFIDYVQHRREMDDEYARLNGVADVTDVVVKNNGPVHVESPETVVHGDLNASCDEQEDAENVGEDPDVPRPFRSVVANKAVVLYLSPNGDEALAEESVKVARELVKQGYPIAIISMDSKASEQNVKAMALALIPELADGQALFAFKEDDITEAAHLMRAVVEIENLFRQSNGQVVAFLTNDGPARVACDLFIGAGIAAADVATMSAMGESLVEMARIARGDCQGGEPVPGDKKEAVNHPEHYNEHPSGIECIEVVRHMGFNIGNAVKYLWRCDLKMNAIEDLEKAVWYIRDEIELRKKRLQES